VSELAKLGINEEVEGRLASVVNEVLEGGGFLISDDPLVDQVGESELEHVLSVVLPDSSEVRLV
jgi:hypothetical protein